MSNKIDGRGQYFILAYVLAWISVSAYILLYTWTGDFFIVKYYSSADVARFPLLKSFMYASFAGVLGSVSYCIYAFILYFGHGRFDFRTYRWWYVYRPIQGGILGIAVYALVVGGLFAFGSGNAGIQNNYTLFGIAFLAGYGVEQVLGRIKEISETVFGKTKEREKKSE